MLCNLFFVWQCLCGSATLKQVSLVRNPSSEISLCAEGIFFQDSLFCILCVFSWDADLETQCTLWVPLCLFPAQTALVCSRLISFGLINGAPGHTQISYPFHFSFIYYFYVEYPNEKAKFVSIWCICIQINLVQSSNDWLSRLISIHECSNSCAIDMLAIFNHERDFSESFHLMAQQKWMIFH